MWSQPNPNMWSGLTGGNTVCLFRNSPTVTTSKAAGRKRQAIITCAKKKKKLKFSSAYPNSNPTWAPSLSIKMPSSPISQTPETLATLSNGRCIRRERRRFRSGRHFREKQRRGRSWWWGEAALGGNREAADVLEGEAGGSEPGSWEWGGEGGGGRFHEAPVVESEDLDQECDEDRGGGRREVAQGGQSSDRSVRILFQML